MIFLMSTMLRVCKIIKAIFKGIGMFRNRRVGGQRTFSFSSQFAGPQFAMFGLEEDFLNVVSASLELILFCSK